MSERRPCIRCGRAIDAWAKICPYCNQDQTAPVPSDDPAHAASTYVPKAENKLRKRLLMAGGAVVLVIAMFAVGFAIINHKTSLAKEPEVKEEVPEVAPPPARPSSDVKLVPTSEMPTSTELIEAPITSAPATNSAENVPTEYQRTDATAVASDEYAQMAARDKAARKKKMDALIDPRTLSGAAYNQGAAPPPRPMISAAPPPPAPVARPAAVTRPIPEYQPIPRIRVSHNVTARLDLMIGADGRVTEVNLREAIPGESARLIAAIQSWRFKPATENGVPVAAPFTVDISFHADE
ncbi:MAG TPA: energy transducer TonB [Thermoanaerobaculia bacterium]|jgi:TonB family protein|nr:energy transducer TonB [Thermoanaerobaculia bacterium]